MRIAQISTVGTPVRETGSGSIEGLVWVLTRELIRMGHDVTVFAIAGSKVPGDLVATLAAIYGAPGVPDSWQVCEWINLCRAVEEAHRFDVLHSHGYLYGLPLQRLARAPMVHTLHVGGNEEFARLWHLYPESCVTAVSAWQWSAFPELRPAAVIHHGVDAAQFTFRAEPEDYACFLGRFIPGKGPVQAIQAARSLGLRIALAGPSNDYYREHVAPLVDGHSVAYLGPIGGAARSRLLGGARVLLYPIQQPEPFGLVLIEAMMCGTPVAAIGLGAVREIVDEGVTGCCAANGSEFSQAVARALTLDRAAVRRRADERFPAERMAREYLQVYEQVLADRQRAGAEPARV